MLMTLIITMDLGTSAVPSVPYGLAVRVALVVALELSLH